MFNLGLGELLLVALAFFLISPKDLPKLMRKLGEYVAKIRQWMRETGVDKAQAEIQALGREFEIGADPNSSNPPPHQLPGLQQDRNPRPAGIQDPGPNPNGPPPAPRADAREQLRKKHLEPPKEHLPRDDFIDEEWIDLEDYENLRLGFLSAIARDFHPDYTERIFKLLVLSRSSKVRVEAVRLLKRDPLFGFPRRIVRHRLGAREAIPVEDAAIFHYFDATRVKELTDFLRRVPESNLQIALPYLADLPGIETLDLPSVFAGNKSHLYDDFKQTQRKLKLNSIPRVLTVIPSYYCDRGCNYCFSIGQTATHPKAMTLEEFRIILDSMDAGIKEIGLFGGEPSLFPDLEIFMDEIETRKLAFTLATNGLGAPELFQRLGSRTSLTAVTFHIDKVDLYTPKQITNLMANIASMVSSDRVLILRLNLNNGMTGNWDWLKLFIDAVPEFNLGFAVTFPSPEALGGFVPLEELRNFVPIITSLVAYIEAACSHKRHSLTLAKPFPLCLFSENDLLALLPVLKFKSVCELDLNDGHYNLTVNPDGTYHPCMALCSEEFRFGPSESLAILPSDYYRTVSDIVSHPLVAKCGSCRLFAAGTCQGGCFAYRYQTNRSGL